MFTMLPSVNVTVPFSPDTSSGISRLRVECGLKLQSLRLEVHVFKIVHVKNAAFPIPLALANVAFSGFAKPEVSSHLGNRESRDSYLTCHVRFFYMAGTGIFLRVGGIDGWS